jgi:hypothetical protein
VMAAGGHAAAAAGLSREAVLAGVCGELEGLVRHFDAHGFAGRLAGSPRRSRDSVWARALHCVCVRACVRVRVSE